MKKQKTKIKKDKRVVAKAARIKRDIAKIRGTK